MYDRFGWEYHQKRAQEADNLYNLYLDLPTIEELIGKGLENKKILDLGCGSGILVKKLVDSGGKVSGIDFSETMINIAKKNNPTVNFTVGEIERTPYKDRYFDLVVSGLVMHYVKDLQLVFREVERILNDRGVFVFTMHHPFNEVMELTFLESESEFKVAISPYFHNEQYRWKMLENMDLISYHHTFENISESLFASGFAIERIKESHAPTSVKDKYPHFYAVTNRYPSFCGFKAIKIPEVNKIGYS